MKTVWKVILISLLFYLLVPLAFVTYSVGGSLDIFIFFVAAPIGFIIIWLVSNRWWMVLLFGVNFAASYFLHVELSTYLYYTHISSDGMTPVVGFLIACLGTIIALIISVILTVIKAIILKKRARKTQNAIQAAD